MDPASCSNLNDLRLTQVHLELNVDFQHQLIEGKCWCSFTKPLKALSHVILDVFELDIHSVTSDKHPLKYTLEPFTEFGEKLVIKVDNIDVSNPFELLIEYHTRKQGPGLCWLTPEQTAGKKHPYVYSQGQEVLNRSVFPCQDSPSTRITYTAKITVPEDLTCVMSARLDDVETVADARKVYCFTMPQSIPVYLVAFAVGELAKASIGPRSSIWTEPCLLEKARAEFDGVPEMYIAAGEEMFGAYQWETYDLLVMPPSFPYGGMENPRLTFVSPTVVAGDRSLTDVIAHEIAHSWFGNLTTNATWSDFFLNEGFTMYAQRRIMSKVHGSAITAIETRTGQELLRREILNLGEQAPLTRLRVPLEEGIDPGECYNECAYEKGYALVCYLRSFVTSDEEFDKFLSSYCAEFAFRSIHAEEMFAFFLQYFPHLDDGNGDLKGEISIATWLHEPGFPKFSPDCSAADSLIQPAEALAERWCNLAQGTAAPEELVNDTKAVRTWPLYQTLHFLDCCLSGSEGYSEQQLLQLEQSIINSGVIQDQNSELVFRWVQLVIKSKAVSSYGVVTHFLTIYGKQKYLLPLYTALVSGGDETLTLAKEIYNATRPTIHTMVRARLERLLH